MLVISTSLILYKHSKEMSELVQEAYLLVKKNLFLVLE